MCLSPLCDPWTGEMWGNSHERKTQSSSAIIVQANIQLYLNLLIAAHIHSTLHVFYTSYLHIAIYTLYLLSIQTNKEPYYVIRDGKPSLVFSLSINRLDVEDDLSVEEMKKIVLTQSPRTQTPGGHTLFIILLSTYLEYGIYILLAFQLLHQFKHQQQT